MSQPSSRLEEVACPPSTTPTREEALRRCMLALAADTFSPVDAPIAGALRSLDTRQWEGKVCDVAWALLTAYRRQLLAAGYDFDEVPAPSEPLGLNTSLLPLDRPAPATKVPEIPRLLSFSEDGFLLHLAFEDRAAREHIRAIEEVRCVDDKGVWRVPWGAEAALVELGVLPDAAGILAPVVPPVSPQVGVWQEGDQLVLAHPYDPELVDEAKQLGGRYDGKSSPKCRRFPLSRAREIGAFAERHGLPVYARLDEELGDARRRAEASRAIASDFVTKGLAREAWSFQAAGVAYNLETRRTIVADEPGLGKTLTALATLEAAQAYPAVVVCKAKLRTVWADEITKWLPHRAVTIVDGRRATEIVARDITIVDFDVVDDRTVDLLRCAPRALIVDEAHYCKDGGADRTQAVQRLADAIPHTGLVLLISGTISLNRPAELIKPLEIVGRLKEFGGFEHFVRYYCDGYRGDFGWVKDGANLERLPELHERLRERCYLRRRKSDVLDLPPPRVESVPLPLTPSGLAEYRRAEADILDYVRRRAASRGQNAEARVKSARKAEALVRLNALRRLAAEAKLPAAIEWLRAKADEVGKVVVFAWHREIQERLADELEAAHIFGSESEKDIEAAKRRFQNDPDCKVIVCSLQAATEGHTLTAAHDVVLVEEAWTPATIAQATARCYGRLSDPHTVTCWHLIAEDTIDVDLVEAVAAKAAAVDALVDGIVNPEAEGSSVQGVLRSYCRRRGVVVDPVPNARGPVRPLARRKPGGASRAAAPGTHRR